MAKVNPLNNRDVTIMPRLTKEVSGNGRNWTILERVWMLSSVVNHALAIGIAACTCYYALVGDVGLYELHIALATIGYQFLMAQAIMTFTEENIWSYFLDRNTRKSIHLVLGFIGSTLAVAGSSLMIYKKTSHFNTPHGILGFVAMIFVLTTFVNGPVAYFAAKIKLFKIVFIKLNHYMMGTIAFVLGMASLILGFQKSWFIKKTSPEASDAVVVLSCITIFLTMRSALVKIFNMVKGLFSN